MLKQLIMSFIVWASVCIGHEMTLEEKVGQLLLVHFNGEEVNDDARSLIQRLHVGGFIYYTWANGLHSPSQVLKLSLELQMVNADKPNSIPLFIAVDQEGGLVSRLNEGFTNFSGNRALGSIGDAGLAESCAFCMGRELQAVGVNFNLAPVVDINTNPRNPVVGIRSFGNTSELVVKLGFASILGYQKAGIITSLKHFPGHGDVNVDSHHDLPVLTKSKEQLDAVELVPFKILANNADTIMTAHIMIPLIDQDNCATLSKKVIDVLRDEIGFQGVVVTDSLVMEGLLKNCASIDDAAVRAFNAGCDIIMLGGKQLTGAHQSLELTFLDVERIHQTIVAAVNRGEISESRLDEAVKRILALKNKYNLKSEPCKNRLEQVNSKKHHLLANKIAKLSLHIKQNNQSLDLKNKQVAVFAPKLIQEAIEASGLTSGDNNTTLFFNGLELSDEELKRASDMVKKADACIFFSYNAWKNPTQKEVMQKISDLKKPLILIAIRDPLDGDLFSNTDLTISTFSPAKPSIEAVCEYLFKKRL